MESGPNGHEGESTCPKSCRCCCRCGPRPARLPHRGVPSSVQEQTRPPDQVVIVRDGPVDAALADAIAELAATSPVPVDVAGARPQHRPRPRARRRAGRVPARRRRPDGRRRHQPPAPLRRADADHRGRGATSSGRGWSSSARAPRTSWARRTPPTDPADIRARPLRRPVQPPHGRLPAGAGAGRRRLHRLRADGGLPALGEDDRRRGARWRTSPSRWCATGSAPARTRAAAGWRSCGPSWGCSGGSAALGFTTGRQFLRNVVVRGGYRLVPEGVRKVATGGWWPVRGTQEGAGVTPASVLRVKTRSNAMTVTVRLDTIGVPRRVPERGMTR